MNIEELCQTVAALPFCKQYTPALLLKIWKAHFNVVENALRAGKTIITPLGTFSFTEEVLDVGTRGRKVTRKPLFQVNERFARAHQLTQRKQTMAGHIPTVTFSELEAATHAGVTRDKIADALTHIKTAIGTAVRGHRGVRLNAGIGLLSISGSGAVTFLWARSFAEQTSVSTVMGRTRPLSAASSRAGLSGSGTIPFRKADGKVVRRPVSARTVYDKISKERADGTAIPTKCQKIAGHVPTARRSTVTKKEAAPGPVAPTGGLSLTGTAAVRSARPATAKPAPTRTVEDELRDAEIECGIRDPRVKHTTDLTFRQAYAEALTEELGADANSQLKSKKAGKTRTIDAKTREANKLSLEYHAKKVAEEAERERREEKAFVEYQEKADEEYHARERAKYEKWRALEIANAQANKAKAESAHDAQVDALRRGVVSDHLTEFGDVFAGRKDPPTDIEKAQSMLKTLDQQVAFQNEQKKAQADQEKTFMANVIAREAEEMQELARVESAKRRASQRAQARVLKEQMANRPEAIPSKFGYGAGMKDPFADRGDEKANKLRIRQEALQALTESDAARELRDAARRKEREDIESAMMAKIEQDRADLEREKEEHARRKAAQQLENRRAWTAQMSESKATAQM